MKEYSFVVDGFDPKESESPDGVLLQMPLDKAELLAKSFLEQIEFQRKFHPLEMPTRIIGMVLCGSLFLDSINGWAEHLPGFRAGASVWLNLSLPLGGDTNLKGETNG